MTPELKLMGSDESAPTGKTLIPTTTIAKRMEGAAATNGIAFMCLVYELI